MADRDNVSSQSKGKARLLPIIKDSGSRSSGFLSNKQFNVDPGVTWSSSCPSVGTKARETSKKNKDATAIAVGAKLFTLSDPVVLCLP